MKLQSRFRGSFRDGLAAFQFLTRLPGHLQAHDANSLSRSVKFFPLVGAFLGLAAALLQRLLLPHFTRPVVATMIVSFTVFATGALHEDGLADTADALGGGWTREDMLRILRDSRIGTYGAVALLLSLLVRVETLSSLPLAHLSQYLVAAHVLCRWTTLPLSYFLPPARSAEGQGARIAQLVTLSSLITGTIFALAVVLLLLRQQAIAPVLAAATITLLSARHYMHTLGGVTGDCFGATNQLTEIAVYLCGAWIS